MTTTLPFTTAIYSTQDSSELALDVFTPTTESRRCAVLVLHGGGSRFGAKEHVHDRAAALAEAGFTALAVQYRLLDAAPWPATLTDAGEVAAGDPGEYRRHRHGPGLPKGAGQNGRGSHYAVEGLVCLTSTAEESSVRAGSVARRSSGHSDETPRSCCRRPPLRLGPTRTSPG